MRIKEEVLNDIFQFINKHDISIKIVDLFILNFEFHRVNINYNRNSGFIYIEDENKKNVAKINITTVCYVNLKNAILKIKLDNSMISIKVKT